ncbi:predicted protein [Lichtheimia corymbifera JMRC:FSU:9682]|uniref:Uncharacterized protein n=1 Tax=Lichtheimia corymbifera JMRC:FSU:9682 TaxID=1263082 RepID=A0A068RJE9_9FUNG|nr:predicted protein [Lichtheimia corymbifera JMRC:FSU:9682]
MHKPGSFFIPAIRRIHFPPRYLRRSGNTSTGPCGASFSRDYVVARIPLDPYRNWVGLTSTAVALIAVQLEHVSHNSAFLVTRQQQQPLNPSKDINHGVTISSIATLALRNQSSIDNMLDRIRHNLPIFAKLEFV